ncbi:hypothetical protein [Qipengyuania sp.]|uniref:hypothetical protein n=1 Tax=Qipengyuania sp. TaxID=2004515 RepID=UPI003512B460
MRQRQSQFHFVPLDDRIEDGRFYLVKTANEFLHCAQRRAGRWVYGANGPAVEGQVEKYCVPRGAA